MRWLCLRCEQCFLWNASYVLTFKTFFSHIEQYYKVNTKECIIIKFVLSFNLATSRIPLKNKPFSPLTAYIINNNNNQQSMRYMNLQTEGILASLFQSQNILYLLTIINTTHNHHFSLFNRNSFDVLHRLRIFHIISISEACKKDNTTLQSTIH